jgi:hypothetical protein
MHDHVPHLSRPASGPGSVHTHALSSALAHNATTLQKAEASITFSHTLLFI